MEIEMLAAAALGIAFGTMFFFNGFRNMKRRKIMGNVSTSKINSLTEGIVEIHGTVDAGKSNIIKSPISNSDCICSKVIVEDNSDNLSRGKIIKEIIVGDEFILQDDTGKILVTLQNAELNIPVWSEHKTSRRKKSDPQILEFFKKNDIKYGGFLSDQYVCKELIIRSKDELYVLGHADNNPHFKQNMTEEIQNVMMQKNKNPNIYVISNHSETQILEKTDPKNFVQLIGGPLIIGGSLLFTALNLLGIIR